MLDRGPAQPGRHRRDSADDQGRDRRAGAPPGPAAAVGARRRRDGRAGISEAVLWFIRRWLVARATMGVEADIRKDLYARLQILPMSFHGRWQSGQLLSRVMNDLSTIRQFLSFGLLFLLLNVIQIIVVTGILLAMYWPLGVVVVVSIVPITADGAALPAAVHPAVAAGAGPVRPRRHPRRGVGARPAGGQVVRPRGLRLRPVRPARHRPVRHRGAARSRCRRSSGRCWRSSRTSPDHRARPRRLRRGPRPGHDGHAGRVHHDDAVAGVAHRLAGLPAVDDAGVDDGGQPRRRDLRRATRDHRRPARRGAARRSARTGRRRLPVPRLPTTWALRHVNVTVEPGETLALVGADRIGQVGAGRAAVAALRRHRGRDPASTATTSASCRCPRCGRRWPPRSRIRRCSRCRWPRTCGSADRDATEEQLAQAVEVAAAQFVYDLPFGLDTRIGEQGMSLSGGQRQRLSLARAHAGRPVDPGARRHAVGARRAHRGRRHRGAAPGAARR